VLVAAQQYASILKLLIKKEIKAKKSTETRDIMVLQYPYGCILACCFV